MNPKKHYVRHHNMFGPSCEVESINNENDFKIYCHKEHKICVPKKCNECKYFCGSEMGKGVCCIWEEPVEDIKGDDHVVNHDEVYFEFSRVENPETYAKLKEMIDEGEVDLCKLWLGLD